MNFVKFLTTSFLQNNSVKLFLNGQNQGYEVNGEDSH